MVKPERIAEFFLQSPGPHTIVDVITTLYGITRADVVPRLSRYRKTPTGRLIHRGGNWLRTWWGQALEDASRILEASGFRLSVRRRMNPHDWKKFQRIPIERFPKQTSPNKAESSSVGDEPVGVQGVL